MIPSHFYPAGSAYVTPPVQGQMPDVADYFACWEAWRHAAGTESEQRNVAVNLMKNCLLDRQQTLMLCSLGLSSLPMRLPPCHVLMLEYNQLTQLDCPLPATLRVLLLNSNNLTALPDNLPDGLISLNVQHNPLRQLPLTLPDTLEQLNIAHCQVDALPASLPDTLVELRAEANPLRALPERLPAALRYLDLSRCLLETLPASLPDALTDLFVSDNRLTALPAHLPAALTSLNADRNQLAVLPDTLPQGLAQLSVYANPLSRLPDSLPQSLQHLDFARCQVTQLPTTLPDGLEFINAIANQFTDLPADISTLPTSSRLYLDFNPLSEAARRRAASLIASNGDLGNRLFISLYGDQEMQSTPRLREAAASWFPPSRQAAIGNQWLALEDENGAASFSLFLQRLQDTVNARQDANFRQRIRDWLTHLAEAPGLRLQTFMVAQDANSSCEDRVTFFLNEMAKLEAVYKVERGDYDSRLPALLLLARQLFRLELLAVVAREKVAAHPGADEIEVWLALQTRLRDALALESVAQAMRFSDLGQLDDDELASTLQRVQTQEQQQFPLWLAQWSAWQSLLQRLDPARQQAAAQQRSELLAEFYPHLTNKTALAALAEAMVEQDPDARRTISKTVFEQSAAAIDLQTTRDFLATRQLAHLLDESSTDTIKQTYSLDKPL